MAGTAALGQQGRTSHDPDQTILEYGGGLAEYVATDDTYLWTAPHHGQEFVHCRAVNRSNTPVGLRERALDDARQHWERLRNAMGLRRRR